MSLSSLVERAATPTPYAIIDHNCAGLEPVWRGERANRTELPPATYYLSGVTPKQREVYDTHCEERFASRSPYHYSSTIEVEEKSASGADPWAAHALYSLTDVFVAFDGLVLDDNERRLYAFERLPGFNGLARLLLALDGLGLARLMPDGMHAILRPSDLTLATFAARHNERVGELPEQRGIENVHSFTYSRTFGADADENAQCAADGVAAGPPAVTRHKCVFVMDQFWTVNYWHWITDALPKALVFAELRGRFPECKPLTYDTGFARQYLKLLGFDDIATYERRSLVHTCRALLPSHSALDAATLPQLRALRGAVLPAAAAAAAAAAGASRRWAPIVLQVRRAEDSVHGAGRSLTNLAELERALRKAFGGRELLNLEVVGPSGLTVVEQVEAYRRAEVVIGTHGAGFANTLWAPAGCHVVEIVPIDVHLDFQCGLTPFWHVAELLGLRKHAFIAYAGRMFESFELPVLEFVAFLRASGVLEAG